MDLYCIRFKFTNSFRICVIIPDSFEGGFGYDRHVMTLVDFTRLAKDAASWDDRRVFGNHRHSSMAPSKKPSTKSASSGSQKQKKEKLFHPQSRKAGQLVRKHIRKSKLEDLVCKRSYK